MLKVEIGMGCVRCFEAINFRPEEIADDPTPMIESGRKLSLLAEEQHLRSLHTGALSGFTWAHCECCGCEDAGQRWPIYGLRERADLRV